MSKAYSAGGTNASAAATKTAIAVTSTTGVRPRVFDLIIGSSATPADQALKYQIAKFTAGGTAGSTPTPTPLDTGDIAAVATAGAAHTAEPTYGAALIPLISLNQRATFRWVATPGAELVAPATASNGVGAQLVTATTSLSEDCTLFWYE